MSFVDFTGGFISLVGLLAALWEANRTGKGRDVDVALMDGALVQLAYMATWALNCGYVPQKFSRSAHPSMVPAQNFETKDGWISVLCLKQSFFPILVERMGLAALADDSRFQMAQDRFENREVLLDILEQAFREKTNAEWTELLQGYVPFAPVNTVAQAMADPQILARNMIVEMEHPVVGTMKVLGSPIRMPGADMKYVRAPYLGEHTREVLGDLLGMDAGELEALREKNIVSWSVPPEG